MLTTVEKKSKNFSRRCIYYKYWINLFFQIFAIRLSVYLFSRCNSKSVNSFRSRQYEGDTIHVTIAPSHLNEMISAQMTRIGAFCIYASLHTHLHNNMKNDKSVNKITFHQDISKVSMETLTILTRNTRY